MRGTAEQLAAGEALYEKLRPGPGLSAEQVLANQRARLSGAMIELVADRGYADVTVRLLSGLAGVSTKTFYDCFLNLEDCFAATYARILHDALRRARDATPGDSDGLRKRILAFFGAIGSEPKAAKLVLVESQATGTTLAERVRVSDRALERFIGRELAAVSGRVHATGVAQGAAAAALRLARSQLAGSGAMDVRAMADDFSDWLLAICDPRFRHLAGRDPILEPNSQSAPGTDFHIRDDRRCLIAAVAKLTMRDGYEALTVPAIRREAGVSRRSFDESFDGIEDCFLAAIEDRIDEAVERATPYAAAGETWERTAARAFASLFGQLSRDPLLAHLGLINILAPGRSGFELRERIVSRWADCLHRTVPSNLDPSPFTAEASVAAAIAMARAEVAAGRLARVRRVAPGTAFLFLAPAIGPAAAEGSVRAELEQATESRRVRKHSTEFS